MLRGKEAGAQLAIVSRQLAATKTQRDGLDERCAATASQLRALHREVARRTPTVHAAVQAGGDGGDDGGSLAANAAAAAAASAATSAMAAAAPARAATLVRALLALQTSAPMRLARGFSHWSRSAARRRTRRTLAAWRAAEEAARRATAAERGLLTHELRCAEAEGASSASTLLRHVATERDRRAAAEGDLRRAVTPLALQEDSRRMREALQLEVIARTEAEAKAHKLQRQHAALDSQLRIATETGARLQREKKALMAR